MIPEDEWIDPKIKELLKLLLQDVRFRSALRNAKEKFVYERLKGKSWSTPVNHTNGMYEVVFKLSIDGRFLSFDKIEKIDPLN